MATTSPPLSRESVFAAHDAIRPLIHHTPLLTSTTLSSLAPPNTTLLFKCENLQKIGAFKIRGASHALSRLSDAELARGVVTHSSGNHAQALALAARTASEQRGFAIPAYVVMPSISTPSKVAATRGYGAEVVFSGSTAPEREAVVAELQARTGAVLVPPYDHADIILGQGTLALEMLDDAAKLGKPLDAIIAPCGGGGMLSGVALACQGTGVRVYGAEPREGADDLWTGLRQGKRVEAVTTLTVADGLRTPVGVTNWGVLSNPDLLKGVFTVTEEQIKSAMRLVVERMKILIEPSSAVPVAVALYNDEWRKECEGKQWNVGIVLSGGNTTIEKMIEVFGVKTVDGEPGL